MTLEVAQGTLMNNRPMRSDTANADIRLAIEIVCNAECRNCAHYDANSSATEGVGYCTNPNGWHRARSMPPIESCSKWEKADA